MAREYSLAQLRNIGIMAHIDAGKTTLSERILYYTGKSHKIGEVHDGDATMDWMEQEQERGITITSAATTTIWQNHMINLIDTPGHVDFTVEVERSLRVLDAAIALFCAVGGIEPQSEMVWRQADKYEIPRIVFINKLDRRGADFYAVLQELHKEFHINAVPLILPIGQGDEFQGIIDLVQGCAVYYSAEDQGATFYEKAIPAAQQDAFHFWRQHLLEKLSESDEEILAKFCHDEPISTSQIRAALRQATLERQIYPVLCGSAFKNKGIQRLLDAVVAYLPSPLDRPPIKATDPQGQTVLLQAADHHPLAALAFKVVSDRHIAKLNYVRVYAGVLRAGAYVYNSSKNKRQRVGRLLRMHANQRTAVSALYSGEIGAVVGLDQTVTGNTICDAENRVLLEAIEFPTPVISMAIRRQRGTDEEKMHKALAKIAEEDPSFVLGCDAHNSETIISGMGELHLEIICERLRREFGVNVSAQAPQVAYRETITTSVEHQAKLVKQTGGRGQYAHIVFRLEPLAESQQLEFVNRVANGHIPQEFIPAVEKGVVHAMERGVMAGFPVMQVRFVLLDGSFHAVDSSKMAFERCAQIAFAKAFRRAQPEFQEPIMNLCVTTPTQYAGSVISDICSQRGRIAETVPQRGAQFIRAWVPLANLFGYATRLRSTTQGRASFSMHFDHYRSVPYLIAEEIISQQRKRNYCRSDSRA